MVEGEVVLVTLRGVLRVSDDTPERDGETDRQQLDSQVPEQDG